MGFLASPPHVVDQLQALLGAGRRDELLAFFMQEVAGLPPDQVELMRSLPAWEARLDAADTIPREERASMEYVFEPDRFRDLDVPTMFLQGGDSPDPFKAAGEALRAALPDCRVVVMPGSDMPRWTPAPTCSLLRCGTFWRRPKKLRWRRGISTLPGDIRRPSLTSG